MQAAAVRLLAFSQNRRKDNRLPGQAGGVYRVKNWPEYNAGLIERGDVSLWIEEEVLAAAPGVPGQPGRPQAYCGSALQMLLTIKSVCRLPLRASQGFAISLQRVALPSLPVPNYSTLSRRAKALEVVLLVLVLVLVLRDVGEAMHLLVNSTGWKLFGEGE